MSIRRTWICNAKLTVLLIIFSMREKLVQKNSYTRFWEFDRKRFWLIISTCLLLTVLMVIPSSSFLVPVIGFKQRTIQNNPFFCLNLYTIVILTKFWDYVDLNRTVKFISSRRTEKWKQHASSFAIWRIQRVRKTSFYAYTSSYLAIY